MSPARRRIAATGAVTLSMLLTACGGASSEVDIPIQDPDLVATGEELYAANCAECHGADLRGTDKGPSHLSEVYEPDHHADGAFLFAVQAGSQAHHWSFGDMPPIDGLSSEDVEAIVAFVREQQRIHGFEPYTP
ncbi:MAG TPA: cytochrome c [Acidimicrobiia bacterium]